MTFTLRLARLTDAPALSAFAQENFPHAAPAAVPREAVAQFAAEQLSESAFTGYITTGSYEFLLVVDEDGKIIGYSGIDTLAPQPVEVPGRAAYLSKFYIGQQARGSGLARALIGRVIEDAAAAGFDGLHLGTHQENFRAQRFYQKMGFTRVGVRTFELAPGVLGDDFIYHLPIQVA